MDGRRQPHIDLFVLATPALADADLAACAACLDAGEQARAQRLPEGATRRDFIAAHGLARFALSRKDPATPPAGWRFRTGTSGKPSVIGASGVIGAPDLRVSLTHSRDLVAVAVAEGMELGVDAERIVPAHASAETAAVFCTAREAQALAAIGDTQARTQQFFALWTLKESLLKALGTGFARAPQSVGCTLDPLTVVQCFPGAWHAWHFPFGDHHHLALAAESPGGAPHLSAHALRAIADLAAGGAPLVLEPVAFRPPA